MATNGLHTLNGQTWWVPEHSSISMAVELDSTSYHAYALAIRHKLEALMERAGPLDRITGLITEYVKADGGSLQDEIYSFEQLAQLAIERSSLWCRIEECAPGTCPAASLEEAREAVLTQSDLTLFDFIG